MVALLRSFAFIFIIFLYSLSLHAKTVFLDSYSSQENKVALFGLFGNQDDDNTNENDEGFAADNDNENILQLNDNNEQEDTNNVENMTLLENSDDTKDDDTNTKDEKEKPNNKKQKSLKGKNYYVSLTYSNLLSGTSVVDYFSMEKEDPNIDDSPLVPVFTTDESSLASTSKTAVALGKYYPNWNSSIEFEYTQFYVRAESFDGGSIYATNDDRLYRTWTSGLIIWKYDLIDFYPFNTSPITIYSALGAGFTYTTLSKKESNMIQFAYTYGLGASWRLNSTLTFFGDFRYNANISSMETFSQGYDQEHSVSFIDFNLGIRLFVF